MSLFLARVQFVLFISNIDTSSRRKIVDNIQRVTGDRLDVDPILLPIGQDSPPEMPIIVLQNVNTGWELTLNKLRIDLVVQHLLSMKDNHPDFIAESKTYGKRIASELAANFGARYNRLGLITGHLVEMDNAPAIMQRKFLSGNQFDGAQEASIQRLHSVDIDGLSLYKWVRLFGVYDISPAKNHYRMELDINTRPEPAIEVTNDLIDRFYQVSTQLIQTEAQENQI